MKTVFSAFLIFITQAFLPNLANAGSVGVRTGEHDGFTRLVLDFETLPEWTAGRNGVGYSLVFQSTEALDFLTEDAMRTIWTDRIVDLRESSDLRSLSIELGCDCAADIFAISNNRLVVDIRPRPFGQWATHEAELTEQMPAQPLSQLEEIQWVFGHEDDKNDELKSFPDQPPARMRSPMRFPDVSEVMSSELLDGDTSQMEGMALRMDGFGLPFLNAPSANGVMIDALSQQLARAISQGLIEKADIFAPVEMEVTENKVAPGNLTRNFRSLTVFDRDKSEPAAFSEATAGGVRCFAGLEVQLSKWGDPVGASELGDIRKTAIAENGEITQDGRLRLARYYLALGFGSEARQLALGMPDGDARDIVEAIGEILDHGWSGSKVFEGQLACPGEVALWALLAEPVSQTELPQSTDMILASFSALPRHLRSHLGPVLSERLRQAGEPENARTALNAVTRAGGGSRRQDLTAARLALIGTNPEFARKELVRLTRGTDFAAAEALLELLLDAQRRAVAPDQDWVDDAPSLIRATQGTEIAKTLSVAALRGHIPLERFDELRRSLKTDLPGLSTDVRKSIAKAALKSISSISDDSEFVRSEIGFSNLLVGGDLAAIGDVALVERLYSLGLYERALAYLPFPPETTGSAAISAKVLVANGSIEQAIKLIEASDDPDTEAIQALIFDLQGDFAKAAKAYLDIEDSAKATRHALRAGNWDWLIVEGPPEAALHVRQLNDPASSQTLGPDSLEGYSTLISRSENRRSSARSLLELTEVNSEAGS
jgi:hypothetical protein